MAGPPVPEFGKRRPEAIADTAPPPKRSSHVALLLMGSFAVGGTAYALMPKEKCEPNPPGMAVTSGPQPTCSSRSYFGSHAYGGGSSRYGLFGGGDASSRSGVSSESSGGVTRGGFGGFAEAISAHFSRGG